MTVSAETKQFDLLIDGNIVPSSNKKYFDCINPSTKEVFAKISDATLNDMNTAIKSARQAFDNGSWPNMSIEERGEYLVKIAELIRKNAKELAELESSDVGKTSKHSTFVDVPSCADTFEYFGKLNINIKSRVNAIAAPVKSTTEFEPIGVIGCIVPWNYPLIISAWKVAPALIAGNTIILKPSSSASASLMRLAQIVVESGIPKGVFNIVSSTDHDVASELIKSSQVDMISFTGGTEVGKKVMQMASGNAKKISLELGGKSPNIVFSDCDFEAAIGGTMSAIFMNQGQMCTAGSRLILEDAIYDKFIDELVKRTKKLKIGNASSYDTDFGPIANETQRDTVLFYIKKGIDEGAKLLCGGKSPDGNEFKNGFYVEPTIFSDVKNSMTIAQEEIFGPVLCVIKFSGAEEAISIANDSKYGLAACIWTKDLKKANTVAKKLQTGTVWINTYGGFYNGASFGGYKQSGFGRALGVEGLLEYTRSKNICVDQTPGGKPLAASWF